MTQQRPTRKADLKAHSLFAPLGRHLLAARIACRLSQRSLAERCGLTQTHISRFEKGERQPTLRQLAALAAGLAVPVQWFLSGTERPGSEWRDIVLELHRLGIRDLALGGAAVPGACRPAEELLALAVSGGRPSPRVVEALPAVLAWNPWDSRLLAAYAERADGMTAWRRLAWLVDVVLTIHSNEGFPGGVRQEPMLRAFLAEIRTEHRDRLGAAEADGLGFPEQDRPLPPVSRRWNITYAAGLDVFRRRAEHLLAPGTSGARTDPEGRP